MKTDEFWTFLTTSVSVNTVQGMTHRLNICGSFAYIKITEPGGETADPEDLTEPQLEVQPFTEEAITISLPASLIDKNLMEVSSSDVIDLLNKILKLPFQAVPKAPEEAPIHRVPPSRRKTFQQAIDRLNRP